MARRELARIAKDRSWLGDVTEGEILLDGARVDIAAQAAVHEQRLQLRSEQQNAVVQQRVVQRLDAEPVAGEEQRFAIAIPQGKRKHAAQAPYAVFAPGLPRVHDHFGVTSRAEAIPELHELRNQLLI